MFNSILVVYSAIFGANIRCLSCLVTGQRDYVLHGAPISETLSTWAFQVLCVLTGLCTRLFSLAGLTILMETLSHSFVDGTSFFCVEDLDPWQISLGAYSCHSRQCRFLSPLDVRSNSR